MGGILQPVVERYQGKVSRTARGKRGGFAHDPERDPQHVTVTWALNMFDLRGGRRVDGDQVIAIDDQTSFAKVGFNEGHEVGDWAAARVEARRRPMS
jgi:hypothetical protein